MTKLSAILLVPLGLQMRIGVLVEASWKNEPSCDAECFPQGAEPQELGKVPAKCYKYNQACAACPECDFHGKCKAFCFEYANTSWTKKCSEWINCVGCDECTVSYSGKDKNTGHLRELKLNQCFMYDTSAGSLSMNRAPSFIEEAGWWDQEATVDQIKCKLQEPVLAALSKAQFQADGKTLNIFDNLFSYAAEGNFQTPICWAQHNVCTAIPKYATGRTEGCQEVYSGCQQAFRHLHAMLFTPSANDQTCNNFALKSIRGFFHDSISGWVDGSLLHELEIEMNTGLCQFGKYVSSLSDETTCDPGAIISMAATLAHQACGIDLFDHRHNNQDAYRPTLINKPYRCSANFNPLVSDIDSSSETYGEKLSEFSDVNLMTNAENNEQFWANVMNDTNFNNRYYLVHALEASFAAHAIGRVTCPVGGDANIKTGFFHQDRSNAVGERRLKESFDEAYNVLKQSQCQRAGSCFHTARELCSGFKAEDLGPRSLACLDEYRDVNKNCNDVANGPTRNTTEATETNANPESSFCGMPLTAFPNIKGVPFISDLPAFKSIYPDSHTARQGIHSFLQQHNRMGTSPLQQNYSDTQELRCTEALQFSIPYELTRLQEIKLPHSEILDFFLAKAFDGTGTLKSFWDSCDRRCGYDAQSNRMCGGSGFLFEEIFPASSIRANPSNLSRNKT